MQTQQELSKCGINLLPVEKDASTANINYKVYFNFLLFSPHSFY